MSPLSALRTRQATNPVRWQLERLEDEQGEIWREGLGVATPDGGNHMAPNPTASAGVKYGMPLQGGT